MSNTATRPLADPPARLEATGITKEFPTRAGTLVVLRDVGLSVSAGESVAIMGPSGSGKSTLLNILGTLEPPSGGRLVIQGTDASALGLADLAQFRNRHIGFVFQDHHLLPQCSALENVLIPTLAGGRDPSADQRARELLDRVGLTQRLDHLPGELSGGERQRVAIARALINRPGILLADEPTGNLDRKTAEAVATLLMELHREQATVLVIVTHSPSLAERCGRRHELTDGTLA